MCVYSVMSNSLRPRGLVTLQASLLLLLSRFSRVPTLCDPTDSSPRGSFIPGILQARILEGVAISFSVHGILQARILEWVAIPFPSRSSQPRDWTHISWVSCIGRMILYHWATWEAHSVLSTVSIVYKCQFQSPNSSHPLFPLGIHMFDFHIYVSISALQIISLILFF